MDNNASVSYTDFLAGVRDAKQESQYDQEAFFDYATGLLRDDNAVNDPEPAYLHQSVYAVDGYDSSSFEQDQSIVLFVCDPTVTLRLGRDPDHVPSITYKEIRHYYLQLIKFVEDSISGIFPPEGFEDQDVISLAQTIHEHKDDATRYRLYFLTDRLYTPREPGDPRNFANFETLSDISEKPFNGKPYRLDVWDLSRWGKAAHGEDDEQLFINLADYAPLGVPVVKAPETNRGFDTFMFFFTGSALADLYEKYGSKLMESNVRSFLSFRGKVNKGIRSTICQHPEDFVAYNNGISATASAVAFARQSDGAIDPSRIIAIKDLQIVNGGQTTAAIFNTRKKDKADLSKVLVPAKVVVVNDSKQTTPNFVPNIARFTNSQNKVSQTDLSSTSPFQTRLEALSRRIDAPRQKKSVYANHWYYERARGQYTVERDRLFGDLKRRFNKENPHKQVIKLTDAVKYILSWEQEPAVVSLGAQKSFAHFSKQMSSLTDENAQEMITDTYYKDLVCMKILYDTIRKFVMSKTNPPSWYKGYPGPVTTYALAKISYDLKASNSTLDFDAIWERQAIPECLKPTINYAGAEAMTILIEPDRPIQNVTEWAKKDECWQQLIAKQGSCLQPNPLIIPELLKPGHGQFLSVLNGGNGAAEDEDD
jgi:hypothetical protein